MTTEKMTVHEALCELKTLGKRIDSAISACVPIATREHDSEKVIGLDRAKFADLAKSNHQSALDLINRRSAIKAAISQYNASKKIAVCDKEYTVAEAIWLMEHGLAEKRVLLQRYTIMLNDAIRSIEIANGDQLNNRAERAATAAFDSKEKADPEKQLKFISDYKKAHTLEFEDPMNIRAVIADLEKDITSFEAKVDSAIQVANATTELEITY